MKSANSTGDNPVRTRPGNADTEGPRDMTRPPRKPKRKPRKVIVINIKSGDKIAGFDRKCVARIEVPREVTVERERN